MVKCKICKRVNTQGVYESIPTCCFCQFALRYKLSPVGYFIRKLREGKIGRKIAVELFVKQFPEVVVDQTITKKRVENIRISLYSEYEKRRKTLILAS